MAKYSYPAVPMNHVGATIHLGEGLAGLTFSLSQITHLLSSSQLQASLPYWGLIQGAIKTAHLAITVLDEATSKDEISIQSLPAVKAPPPVCIDGWDHIEDACDALTNLNLIFQGARTLTSGITVFLPWGFALNAAVEFAIAVRRTHELVALFETEYPSGTHPKMQRKRKVYEAYANVVSKLLATLGWAAIALGSPLGWVLIAIASVGNIYSSLSTYQQLNNHGLFAHETHHTPTIKAGWGKELARLEEKAAYTH